MVALRPTTLDTKNNAGEGLIFDALKPLNHVNQDWIVLHSLSQVKGLNALQGETDFVVLIPSKGIVVVEAKGATDILIEDGKWTLQGVPPAAKHKNPFDQIDGGIRGIRGYLKRLGYAVDKIPFARLAWFPLLNEKNLGSFQFGTSIEPFEFAFIKELNEPLKTLRKTIEAHIGKYKENAAIHYVPEYFTAEMAHHIADALRPNLKITVSPDDAAAIRRASRRKATEEQVLLLELIEKNNSIYFEGSAGTGKTEILRQAALDLKKKGRSVLYVCYNLMLAESMASELGQVQGIMVTDINSLLMKIAGVKKAPAKADSTWFEKTLPEQAVEALKFRTTDLLFDAICIDEFQDLASRPLFLEAVLGLKRETFMPFKALLAGDDHQQIAGNGVLVDSYKVANHHLPNLVHISLNTNCRQSPALSQKISRVLGSQAEIRRHRQDPKEPGELEVLETTFDRQGKDLYKVLTRLLETYRPQDIRVLSVFGGHGSLAARLFEEKDLHSSELRELRKLLKHPITKAGKISWRSIAKYKGLENDVVVLTDISKASEEYVAKQGKDLDTQVYVGLTRARTHAVMLVQDGLYSKHSKKIG